ARARRREVLLLRHRRGAQPALSRPRDRPARLRPLVQAADGALQRRVLRPHRRARRSLPAAPGRGVTARTETSTNGHGDAEAARRSVFGGGPDELPEELGGGGLGALVEGVKGLVASRIPP